MTGNGLATFRGVQTLRKRQSSLCGMDPRCGQAGPVVAAWRTPFHATTGAGGRQRRLAIGGAAKGTPLKARISGGSSDSTARIRPPVTVTADSGDSVKTVV